MLIRWLLILIGPAGLWAQSLDEVVLPAKSEIFIELQRSLDTRTAQTGDKFSALVQVPVTYEDRIIVPVGSWVIGHVKMSERPGHFRGKAQLLLAFDTIILPDGTTRKFQAVLQSAEGNAARPEKDEEGRLEAPGSQKEEVAVGTVTGAVTGVITGAVAGVFRGGAARGAAIGGAVGAAGGALLSLLQKGEDVVLPKGSSLTIQLQEAVRFVRPAPPPERQPLKP